MVLIWSAVASSNKIRLSAKKRWDKCEPFRESLMGFHVSNSTT